MAIENRSVLGVPLLLLGLVTLEGCWETLTRRHLTSGLYAYETNLLAPASSPLFTDGDWDENHEWHGRSWWVRNRRPWVGLHHPDWLKLESRD